MWENKLDIIREIHLVNWWRWRLWVWNWAEESWLLWEVSEAWWVGEGISHLWNWSPLTPRQILRQEFVTFLVGKFNQKYTEWILQSQMFFQMNILHNFGVIQMLKTYFLFLFFLFFNKIKTKPEPFSCVWCCTLGFLLRLNGLNLFLLK